LIRPALLIFLVLFLQGCSPYVKEIRSFSQVNQYFAGFYLLDPATNKVLADYNGDKYFTPASNTKILTLYAAKMFLADPLPVFYVYHDSLATYLWPTANPEFLNPELPPSDIFAELSLADSIVLSFDKNIGRFGSGWAWDDYNSSYSPERSAFPIYSNLATFTLDSLTQEITVVPGFLMDSIKIEYGETFKVERAENSNRFTVTIGSCKDCVRQRPFRLNKAMLAELYSDTLDLPVSINTTPRHVDARVLSGLPQDSVFKVMMQESDNFIAEQLLLQVAGILKDTLMTSLAIDSIQSYLNTFLPDSAIWVDGSGLSRYNMLTPRSVVHLWQEVIKLFGRQRLMNILAVGGVSGTIENWYAANQPYIYGKTGTLRHNHNLSGIIIAKSGRLLLFSFMNNHYSTSSATIKQEMKRVLYKIYEKY